MSSMPNRSSLRIWSPPFGASPRTRNKRSTSGDAWPHCARQAAHRRRRGDRMRRREFITLLGGAAAWPLTARAQQPAKIWRIGFLAGGSRPVTINSSGYANFLRGMRELGYAEEGNFVVEWRFAEGRFELFSVLAAELVRSNVDVIVLGTGTAAPAAKRATDTIPIVMAS